MTRCASNTRGDVRRSPSPARWGLAYSQRRARALRIDDQHAPGPDSAVRMFPSRLPLDNAAEERVEGARRGAPRSSTRSQPSGRRRSRSRDVPPGPPSPGRSTPRGRWRWGAPASSTQGVGSCRPRQRRSSRAGRDPHHPPRVEIDGRDEVEVTHRHEDVAGLDLRRIERRAEVRVEEREPVRVHDVTLAHGESREDGLRRARPRGRPRGTVIDSGSPVARSNSTSRSSTIGVSPCTSSTIRSVRARARPTPPARVITS